MFFVLFFVVVHVSKKNLKNGWGVGGQSEFFSDFFNLTKPLNQTIEFGICLFFL